MEDLTKDDSFEALLEEAQSLIRALFFGSSKANEFSTSSTDEVPLTSLGRHMASRTRANEIEVNSAKKRTRKVSPLPSTELTPPSKKTKRIAT